MMEDKDIEEKSGELIQPATRITVYAALRGNIANVAVVSAIFFIATAIGYLYPQSVPEITISSLMEAEKELEKNFLLSSVSYFGQLVVFIYITFLMGIMVAIPTVYTSLSGGLMAGAIAVAREGSFASAFPHTFPDVMETFALCIAAAWGAKLGFAWFKTPKLAHIKQAFNEGNFIFIKTVLPLLVASLVWRLLFEWGR